MKTSIDYTHLREVARKILQNNDRGGYTVPNADVYPFQWNWDSPFVALGWLTFDEKRAWQELEQLLRGQWANGMVPHIVFHQENENYFPGPSVWQAKSAQGLSTSGITQAPMLVPGAELLYLLAKDRELARRTMSSMYEKLFRYQQWYCSERRMQQIGLCHLFHGWESMDNSPLWDASLQRVTPTTTTFVRKDTQHVPKAQRPRQWEYERYIAIVEGLRSVGYDSQKYQEFSEMTIVDAALNGILLAGHRALLRLAPEFASETQVVQLHTWIAEAERGFRMLWDDELALYVDYDLIADAQIREEVSGGLVPLYAGLSGKNEEKYRNTLRQWISQDMPSVFTHSGKFDAERYWRGPSWSVINFLIYYGSLQQGWEQEAEEIRQRSLEQIAAGGFYENFNVLNRSGRGGASFSWTAATYLYWLDESQHSYEQKFREFSA